MPNSGRLPKPLGHGDLGDANGFLLEQLLHHTHRLLQVLLEGGVFIAVRFIETKVHIFNDMSVETEIIAILAEINKI